MPFPYEIKRWTYWYYSSSVVSPSYIPFLHQEVPWPVFSPLLLSSFGSLLCYILLNYKRSWQRRWKVLVESHLHFPWEFKAKNNWDWFSQGKITCVKPTLLHLACNRCSQSHCHYFAPIRRESLCHQYQCWGLSVLPTALSGHLPEPGLLRDLV